MATTPPKTADSLLSTFFIVLTLLFAATTIPCAWEVVSHTQASTNAIEKQLETYSVKNEGEKALEGYTEAHPFLGFFMKKPAEKQLGLPSKAKADEALSSDVNADLKINRRESFYAAWWSFALVSLSLVYVVTVVAVHRTFCARACLFAMTASSVLFFFVGIIAPAMIIWTAPVIPMATGPVSFVLQHEIRGIAAIIWELLHGGHFVIGGFLLAFSILTPLTKMLLTFFITVSTSSPRNHRIASFLHSIGKWSMADVFVAAILLALYALKFQQATRSIPCLGLYYFIGYCLLSLTTTELLTHSEAAADPERKISRGRMETQVIAGLFAAVFCIVSAIGLFTYGNYTANLKHPLRAPESPQKLDDAHLVMPGHSAK